MQRRVDGGDAVDAIQRQVEAAEEVDAALDHVPRRARRRGARPAARVSQTAE